MTDNTDKPIDENVKMHSAARYLRLLGDVTASASSKTHSMQSRGSGDPFAESTVSLSKPKMEDRLKLLMERLSKAESERPNVFEQHKLSTKAIVDSAKNAWAKLNQEGTSAQLTSDDAIGLEAIVEIDGSRPTLRFTKEGELVPEENTIIGERWKFVVNDLKPDVEKIAESVCRVNLNGKHAGTGFSFGDNVILTNRHVLQDIADLRDDGSWKFKGEVSADFGAGYQVDPIKSFECLSAGVISGRDHINRFSADFSKFDYALLRCNSKSKIAFPEPLPPQKDAGYIVPSMSVFALGFPARPQDGEYSNALLNDLFGFQFGIKRFSPGEVDFSLGYETSDTQRTVFTYDSTTLPGSSGSAVLEISKDGHAVMGLHFAGWHKGNYAHAMAAGNFRSDLQNQGIKYPE